MISLRIGCGVASLAFGIFCGFVLFKGPLHHSSTAETAYELAAAGQPATVIDVYSAQIKKTPKDYLLYLRRGVTFQQARRHEEALADLTEALRLSPPVMTADELGDRMQDMSLPETHRLTLARQLHIARAEALQALDRPDDALADLDATVALNSKDYGARYQRATARTFAGHIGDAVDDFDTILKHRPNTDALVGRANAKYLGGDYAGAADDYGQAVVSAPDRGNYAVWLLKSQLRGHLAIPLKQFEGLPKTNPAWVGIDALLSDSTPQQMAAQLASGMTKDKSMICDGMVFLGEWLVIKADGKNAPAIFEDALGLCRSGTMSHAVATLELRRLATTAAAPSTSKTPMVPAIMHDVPAEKTYPGI